ncbi:MAG: hypothetical protein L0Z73_04965 [Gammaproteobacteria bacterium]|nr:hypothetical protein [Gammaproteobacteria bacterium]
MPAHIPVYSDENNLHYISVFVEESDGTFKRTQSEPLRLLRDNIDGISISQGNVISTKFDKNSRRWKTPTVSFHYGRPQSIYQFLREKIAANRYYVFTKPNLSGRIIQFSLHELRLKPSISQQKLKLLKEKYVEALELWTAEQYKIHQQQKKAAGGGIKARQQRLLEKKKQALQKLKDSHHRPGTVQQRAEDFIRYDNLSIAIPENLPVRQNPKKSPLSIFRPRKSKKLTESVERERDNQAYQRFIIKLE